MAIFVAPTVPFVRIDQNHNASVTAVWPTAFGAAVGRAFGVLRHKGRPNTQAEQLPDAKLGDAGVSRAEVTRDRPAGCDRGTAAGRR